MTKRIAEKNSLDSSLFPDLGLARLIIKPSFPSHYFLESSVTEAYLQLKRIVGAAEHAWRYSGLGRLPLYFMHWVTLVAGVAMKARIIQLSEYAPNWINEVWRRGYTTCHFTASHAHIMAFVSMLQLMMCTDLSLDAMFPPNC